MTIIVIAGERYICVFLDDTGDNVVSDIGKQNSVEHDLTGCTGRDGNTSRVIIVACKC